VSVQSAIDGNCGVELNNFRKNKGRAIAQAVSRRLPIVVARVRAQVSSCGICGRQRVTGAGVLRVLRFPLTILIPSTAPST
jgi:hypothetical protein